MSKLTIEIQGLGIFECDPSAMDMLILRYLPASREELWDYISARWLREMPDPMPLSEAPYSLSECIGILGLLDSYRGLQTGEASKYEVRMLSVNGDNVEEDTVLSNIRKRSMADELASNLAEILDANYPLFRGTYVREV